VNPSFLHFIALYRLVIEGCSAAGLGLAFCFFGVRLFARRYFHGHRSRLRINAATAGPAAIFGRATGPRTLAAPITGSPCYVYRTSIRQREPGAGSEWKRAAEETGCLTFLLEDSTGQLLVEPLGAELDLRQNFSQEFGPESSSANQPSGLSSPDQPSRQPSTQNPIPERIASFLARNGISPDRPIRIEECCLEPATPVFIAGTLTGDALNEDRSLQADPAARGDDASVRPGLVNSSSAANASASSPHRNTDPVLASSAKPEVIRLNSSSAPSSTLQMTQQAKIAAALNRAGITRADLWDSADASNPGSPSDAVANSRAQLSTTASNSSTPTASPTNGNSRTGHPASDSTKTGDSQPTQISAPPAGPTQTTQPAFTITKGLGDTPFLISNQSLPATSLGWTSILLVILGTSLAAFGLRVLVLEYLNRTR
jgi:hypothetical protein